MQVGGGQGTGAHVNPQHVWTQPHPPTHSLSHPLGQLPQSPQNCTKAAQMQALPSATSQQLQLELPLHGIATLHGLLQPQLSGAQPSQKDRAANAGVLMLVRTGAVQAMAAPAPIRFNIFRREIPSFGSSSSGVMSPPSPDELRLTFQA